MTGGVTGGVTGGGQLSAAFVVWSAGAPAVGFELLAEAAETPVFESAAFALTPLALEPAWAARAFAPWAALASAWTPVFEFAWPAPVLLAWPAPVFELACAPVFEFELACAALVFEFEFELACAALVFEFELACAALVLLGWAGHACALVFEFAFAALVFDGAAGVFDCAETPVFELPAAAPLRACGSGPPSPPPSCSPSWESEPWSLLTSAACGAARCVFACAAPTQNSGVASAYVTTATRASVVRENVRWLSSTSASPPVSARYIAAGPRAGARTSDLEHGERPSLAESAQCVARPLPKTLCNGRMWPPPPRPRAPCRPPRVVVGEPDRPCPAGQRPLDRS